MALMPFSALPKYSPEPIGCGFLSLEVAMRRREFIEALGATAAGWPFGAGAQTLPHQLRAETASPAAQGQPPTLTKSQSDALNTYNNAVNDFKSILAQRRVQINSNQGLLTISLTHSRARGADDGGRRRRDASYGVARDSHPVSTTAVRGLSALTLFSTLTRAREAGRRDAIRPARPARAAWVVQRLLAA